MKEFNAESKIKWKRTETMAIELNELSDNMKALTLDLNEQKEHLSIVEQILKNDKEKRDKRKIKWKQVKKNNEDFIKDIRGLRWDLQEHKEQLAYVKPLIKDTKTLQDKCESNRKETETMEIKFGQLSAKFNQLKQHVNEQEEKVTHVKKDDQRGVAERLTRDALEIQQLKSQLEQQHTLIINNTAPFEQMMERLGNVEARLKSVMDGRDKAESEIPQMINKYEVNLNGKQMTMAQIQVPHDALEFMTLVYDWDITDINNTDGNIRDTRQSEEFQLIGSHYGAKVSLEMEGKYISTYIQLIDYEKTKRPIDTKSMPMFTFVIKDLDNSEHNTDCIRMTIIEFKKTLQYEEDILGWSGNFSKMAAPPYLVSNKMKINVYIEPPSMARSFFSNDGILLWRLDNYTKRKQMQVDDLLEYQLSPYFYTGPQGYRVHVRLYLGDTNVRGVLLFLTGEFDSSLALQFPHRLTMTIFNHTDESKNLVVIEEGKVAHHTRVYFDNASTSLLESEGFVTDDSLLIKAVVEPL